MTYTEDHEILDLIQTMLECVPGRWHSTRESECIEFTCPESGRRFEIVVRPIDDEEFDPLDDDAVSELLCDDDEHQADHRA